MISTDCAGVEKQLLIKKLNVLQKHFLEMEDISKCKLVWKQVDCQWIIGKQCGWVDSEEVY